MTRIGLASIVTFSLALGVGCEQKTDEVSEEIQELQAAKNNAPTVARELQAELNAAKASVVRLEKELELAKQGVTHEVREERQELEQALKEQGRDVKAEINQAKTEAQTHNQLSDKAGKVLKDTQPSGRVEATVKTEKKVVPQQTEVQTTEAQETIQLKNTQVQVKEGEPRAADGGPR